MARGEMLTALGTVSRAARDSGSFAHILLFGYHLFDYPEAGYQFVCVIIYRRIYFKFGNVYLPPPTLQPGEGCINVTPKSPAVTTLPILFTLIDDFDFPILAVRYELIVIADRPRHQR